MQQQQPGTVTHSRISSLLISSSLTRPRVASRYSVRPEGSATARLGVRDFEIHWISRGFRISEWISGFHSGFLDFSLDFCRQVSSCMFLDILLLVVSHPHLLNLLCRTMCTLTPFPCNLLLSHPSNFCCLLICCCYSTYLFCFGEGHLY